MLEQSVFLFWCKIMRQVLQKPFSGVASILIILRLIKLTVKFLLPTHFYYLDRVQKNRLYYCHFQILSTYQHMFRHKFIQNQWEDHPIIQFLQNSLLFLGQTLSLILPRHRVGLEVSPKLNTSLFCGTYSTLTRNKWTIFQYTW